MLCGRGGMGAEAAGPLAPWLAVLRGIEQHCQKAFYAWGKLVARNARAVQAVWFVVVVVRVSRACPSSTRFCVEKPRHLRGAAGVRGRRLRRGGSALRG